jgi:ATP-dependent DNA helicase RecQ
MRWWHGAVRTPHRDDVTEDLLAGARVALQRHFGYPGFRGGQERAIESVLAGLDTLVVLPTGGGKSICYQLPALMLPGLTVVVSPLISLMKDQVDALVARGLPAAFVNSTLTSSQIAERLSMAERGELKLLYVAPERFDFGNTGARLRAAGVSRLAVDEAHCISEWGHDFRPSYTRLRDLRERLGAPSTVALTATATPEVRRDIVEQLALRDATTIITGFDRPNLHYHVMPAPTERDKDAALVAAVEGANGLAVVYASTRRAVERITGVLQRARLPAAGYHAGLDDDHRHEVQDSFMRERVRAIVATNAFGMGIDKANVRVVVHYAMPGTIESYYQEAGRAGRDGQHSDCILLHAFPDRFTHEFFIRGAHPSRETIERVFEELVRRGGAGGLIRDEADAIASGLPGKVSAREVESAIAQLVRGGALATELASQGGVFVRLLAAPKRIRSELDDGAHQSELGLLRAIWRAAGGGNAFARGASIDLDGLPPGLGGSRTAVPLLDALQERQFLTWSRTGGGLRLRASRLDERGVRLNWPALDRRRRAELAKLDAMQRYAYTTSCRRAFVLRYFGDEGARQTCSGCDNCLGTAQRAAPASKSRGRTSRPSRTTVRGAAAPRHDDTPLDADGTRLFESLRTWRAEVARKERVPAYVVCTDRTLAEVARFRPRTLDRLGAVHGVGPTRLERYGERLLAVIRADSPSHPA